MADSGQQQPADAEVDTLVNDIFEMLIEMDVRKVDISCERQYFNKLLQDVRNLQPPEVSAVHLRKFMSLLQKTVQNHSEALNAAAADEPDGLAPTAATPLRHSAATGHTHGDNQVESPVGTLHIPVPLLCEGTQRQNVRQSAIMDEFTSERNLQPGGTQRVKLQRAVSAMRMQDPSM